MNPGGVAGLACLLNLMVLLVAGGMTVWVIRGASASNPDGSLLRQALMMRLYKAMAHFSSDPAEAWFRWAQREPGPAMTRSCLEEAIRLGHAQACLKMAELLPAGALRVHPEEALIWYRRAAELGSAEGAYRAGMELAWRPEAAEASQRFLEQAAAAGHVPARDRLAGRRPAPPVLPPENPAPEARSLRLTRALEPLLPGLLLFLALSLGLLFLTFFLSFILTMGALAPTLYWLLLPGPMVGVAIWLMMRGVVSPGQASRSVRRMLDRAAEGDPQALFTLGTHYLKGGGGHPKDLLEARRCFLQAAQAGHPEAMFELSELLRWGSGGPRDPGGATQWLERAAREGSTSAQARLHEVGRT